MNTAKAIRRILTVNHAGEFGAIRIYKAQLSIARLLYKDLVPFLDHMLQDEVAHCDQFRAAMPARKARPCYTMRLWSWGGYALGLVTALMGRNAIMVCTEAVEDTVHHHMNDQINFLDGKDEALKTMIMDIRIEEVEHLAFAQARVQHNTVTKIGYSFIQAATEILIWLSTQGAVSRMKMDIRG